MNRLGWWLAKKIAQSLEPHERDAVCGDQAELGATGTEAVREVLGLVLRRQLALWKDWKPWLALLGIVIPFGVFLSGNSLHLARQMSRFSPLTNGDSPTIFSYAVQFLILAPFLLGSIAVLGSVSWASGYAVGLFSGRTRSLQLAVVGAIWLGVVARRFSDPDFVDYRDEALAIQALRWGATLAVHLLMFVVPAVLGFRNARRTSYVSFPWAVAVNCLPILVLGTLYGISTPGVNPEPREAIWIGVAFLFFTAWPGILILLHSLVARRSERLRLRP